MTADADDAAQRIDRAEQAIDGPLFDDDNRITAAELRGRERSARRDAAAQNLHEPVISAEDAEDPGVVAAVFEPLEQLGPDRRVMDFGEAGDGLGFLGDQLRPDAHLARHRVRIDAGRGKEAEHAKRRRPDDFERIDDLLAKPRHDRRHRHDRGDADDDAEHREGRAQFVGA